MHRIDRWHEVFSALGTVTVAVKDSIDHILELIQDEQFRWTMADDEETLATFVENLNAVCALEWRWKRVRNKVIGGHIDAAALRRTLKRHGEQISGDLALNTYADSTFDLAYGAVAAMLADDDPDMGRDGVAAETIKASSEAAGRLFNVIGPVLTTYTRITGTLACAAQP